MQKRVWLAGLLVLCMLLSSCSLIVKDPEVDAQTEILNINGTSITKAQVNTEVDNYLAYMQQYYNYYMNYTLDTSSPEVIANARETVIDGLIEDEVVKQKQAEVLGDLSAITLTEEEEADVQSRLESAHSTIQSSFYADTELEGEALESAIQADMQRYLGVSEATLRESALNTHISNLFKSKITEGVTVTDEEIQADYDSKVASAKSSYESNLSAYGSAVNGGSTVYYRPAGYRMVKQILIQFSDEDQTVIDDLESKISSENSTISTLTSNLTGAGVEDVDALVNQVKVTMADAATAADVAVASTEAAFEGEVSEENQDNAKLLAEAKARLAAYQALLDAANEKAYAGIREEADSVVAAARAGEDWDALVAEHNDDPGMMAGRDTAETGYAVCENMSGFDSAFTAAAMALQNIGDVSDPTPGSSDGYYIIRYVADVAEGAVELADVKDEISTELLTTKQDTYYDEQVQQWVEAAKVVKNLKALDD